VSLLKDLRSGSQNLSEWLGEGGTVVGRSDAQERADICIKCPANVTGSKVTKAVALAIKKHLAIKNQANLRVRGEKSLGHCNICSCVLRLQIWMPQAIVKEQLTDKEVLSLPDYCWKNKP